ncbi:MAG: SDR family oxidoreductase [Oscillospiraceae bacterium]|nr:SDR family oxidoreductase [Oscillospiraceae bacterium]
MNNAQWFSGKSVWITGAGTAIGQAVARKFYNLGANLLLSGVASPPEGIAAQCLPGDPVTEADADEALSPLDRLDILVTAPRFVKRSGILSSSVEDFDRVIEANLASVFVAARASVKKIGRHGGGAILFVSSIHGEKPTGSATLFSIACGGQNMLMREAAQDAGRLGIRVNMLRAGPLPGDDALFSGAPYSYIYDDFKSRIPRGKIGTPEEIANATAFLCSDDASFINGAILTADGGFLGHYMNADTDKRWQIGFGGDTDA